MTVSKKPTVEPGEVIESIALSSTAKVLIVGVSAAVLGVVIGYNVHAILVEQRREKVDEIRPSTLRIVEDAVAAQREDDDLADLDEELDRLADEPEPSTTTALTFVKPDLDVNAVANGNKPYFGATKVD
jgi:hypothetical protein